jgi:hypothetical protein
MGFLVPAPLEVLAAVMLGCVALLAYATWVGSPWPRRRPPKLVSRLIPAAGMAFTGGGSLALGAEGVPLVLACGAAMAGALALYRRSGPDRTPCDACPERLRPEPCRGIAPVVRRERAFRRLAGRWMSTSPLR